MYKVGERIRWSTPEGSGCGLVVASFNDRIIVRPDNWHEEVIVLFICDSTTHIMNLLEETLMRSLKMYDISTCYAPYTPLKGFTEKDLPINHGNI